MKKGQMTIFITIGVIIMLLGFTILFLYQFPRSTSEKSMSDIESFVQQCVKDVTNDGLNLLSLQGGYIYPTNFLQTSYQKISYDLPEKPIMQQELNKFVEQGLPKCINISMFESFGYSISLEPATAESSINDKVVLVDVNLPITIVKGQTSKKIEHFQAKSSTRLGHVHSIIKDLRKQTEWIDLTKASQQDVDISIIPYQSDLIISVKDTKSYINSNYFKFVTAVKLT
ncbi:MAG: hypothetical protein U9R08_05200 [Nanoarchaeota archaeon]|nr:hypothetical protein [Nanoarchaeota archaeon]